MRFWLFDIVLTLIVAVIVTFGALQYDSLLLPWIFVITLISGPAWILIRTFGAVQTASNQRSREEIALTSIPAQRFIRLRVTRSIWRAMLPFLLMPPEGAAICVHELDYQETLSVTLYSLISLCGIAFALCAVWERLRYFTSHGAGKVIALRLTFLWFAASMITSATIAIGIFGDYMRFPVYTMLFAPLVISAGPLLVRHRYRAAVAQYFDFE